MTRLCRKSILYLRIGLCHSPLPLASPLVCAIILLWKYWLILLWNLSCWSFNILLQANLNISFVNVVKEQLKRFVMIFSLLSYAGFPSNIFTDPVLHSSFGPFGAVGVRAIRTVVHVFKVWYSAGILRWIATALVLEWLIILEVFEVHQAVLVVAFQIFRIRVVIIVIIAVWLGDETFR